MTWPGPWLSWLQPGVCDGHARDRLVGGRTSLRNSFSPMMWICAPCSMSFCALRDLLALAAVAVGAATLNQDVDPASHSGCHGAASLQDHDLRVEMFDGQGAREDHGLALEGVHRRL